MPSGTLADGPASGSRSSSRPNLSLGRRRRAVGPVTVRATSTAARTTERDRRNAGRKRRPRRDGRRSPRLRAGRPGHRRQRQRRGHAARSAEAIGPNPPARRSASRSGRRRSSGCSARATTSRRWTGRPRPDRRLPELRHGRLAQRRAGGVRRRRRRPGARTPKASSRRLKAVTVGQSSDHTFFQVNGIAINGLFTGASETGPGGRRVTPAITWPATRSEEREPPRPAGHGRTAASALRKLAACTGQAK